MLMRPFFVILINSSIRKIQVAIIVSLPRNENCSRQSITNRLLDVPCRFVDGRPGNCVSIRECPVLLNILREQGSAAGDFLRRTVCRYEDNNPVVCCPSDESTINQLPTNESPRQARYGPLFPPDCGFSNTSHGRVVGGVDAELGGLSKNHEIHEKPHRNK